MSFSLLYDSDCGICTSFKDAVAFLDRSHRIRFITLDSAVEAGALEGIPRRIRRASFHLITPTGTVISGANAVPFLAAELPVGNVSRRALEIPSIARFVRSLYGAFVSMHNSSSCNPENRVS
jgi:predicted DCC family thiol-disulfide oxidoreductase YuxK